MPYTLFAVNYAILDKVIPQSDTYNNTKSDSVILAYAQKCLISIKHTS